VETNSPVPGDPRSLKTQPIVIFTGKGSAIGRGVNLSLPGIFTGSCFNTSNPSIGAVESGENIHLLHQNRGKLLSDPSK
jgi:hypothetical protein